MPRLPLSCPVPLGRLSSALALSLWSGVPALAALAAPAAPAAVVAAPKPAPAVANTCREIVLAPTVQLPLGKSTLLRPPSPVARVVMGQAAAAGGDQGTASTTRAGVADVDVLLLGPGELYLMAKSLGTTNVMLAGRDGRCTAFDVVVSMDTSALQAVLQQLLPDEKEVKVTAAFDSIVLSGVVSDTEALSRVTDLAGAYVRGQQGSRQGGAGSTATGPRIVNMLTVGAPQQVMLEVKVAEISKSLLDQYGIDFATAFITGNGTAMNFLSGLLGGGVASIGRIGGTGTSVPLSSVGTAIGASTSNGAGTGGNVTATFDAATGRPVYTTSYGTVPGKSSTNVTANMQKTDGLVKVLAEPSVMAISGQTGSFLAGGKIFIPVSQTNTNGTRDVVLEEKEFGVSVSFTPTVLGSGRINLRVRPEVSELNATGVSISTGNTNTVLPSFTSRKAETTVQLMDGQSFAIGGLIKNNSTTNIKAFPFLGELPVIGALFRSTAFQTDRTELVFVITPRLVKPLPADYKLPTDGYVPPTRSELILKGRTEGERPADAPAQKAPATSPAVPAQGGFDLPASKE